MSTKSVLVAVLLIALGIVFGVTLVSSFKGVDVTFAGADVQIGEQSRAANPSTILNELNAAYSAIAREVTPAVVYIEVTSTRPRDDGSRFFHFFGPEFRFEPPQAIPQQGAGSGVILTSDGYILTNNHVIENADDGGVDVVLHDTRRFRGAKIIGTDKYTDLAVIKIDAKGLSVPRLGDSDNLDVGHVVFAFGNPLGLRSTMTQGIVSAIGRQIGIVGDRDPYAIENFIQTDAAVNPGNSGGPLVDINGDVVGINTAIATTNQRYQGYSFAIPINLAKKVATDLIKYGKAMRGYIGVQISTVDATMARAAGLDRTQGVIINDVNPGSAGEEAGLKSGDIILSVDGREVNTANQLQTVIAGKHPGDVVTLVIVRDKKKIEKKVKLKARDDEEAVVAARDGGRSGSTPRDRTAQARVTLGNIGVTVRNIDADVKRQYEVDHGVLVEEVRMASEAARQGLQQRDVILSVGDQPVKSAAEFEEAIKNRKPGDAVLLRVKGSNKTTRFVAIEIPKQ